MTVAVKGDRKKINAEAMEKILELLAYIIEQVCKKTNPRAARFILAALFNLSPVFCPDFDALSLV